MGLRKSPKWAPETNAKRSESAKRRWADPTHRAVRRENLLKQWEDRGVTPKEAFKSQKKRTCRHCNQEFTIEHGTQRWCKTCCPTPEAMCRLRAYDMSQPEFDAMYQAQDGNCALCHKSISLNTGKLGLTHDHNHTTGRVRGLLCGHCNRYLGAIERDVAWVERALKYLRDNQ